MEAVKQIFTPILPVIFIIGLFFLIGLMFPILSFFQEVFWLIVIAIIILVPMAILAFFLYQAYKKNENITKHFIIFIFLIIMIPSFAYPEVLETRVTQVDMDVLRSQMNENFETVNQTLRTIKEQTIVSEVTEEESENFFFIIFPIILIQIITTIILIFFFRNR